MVGAREENIHSPDRTYCYQSQGKKHWGLRKYHSVSIHSPQSILFSPRAQDLKQTTTGRGDWERRREAPAEWLGISN